MSTLNLKQYLAKIDALLEDQYYDEAVFHSRHILSLFPKNLATYRRLGRAEIGANRWDDANTTLRRVLSFAPDDKIAHIGMSKVYQRTQKKEEALWHLERAYEQDPNNQEIIDELRDLYAAYKKVNNVRLQLTAGAVARQYSKNQLYPQAIKVLKDALRQTPQRVDLQLALARVYRESGDIVAAAEMALDVLDTLPDCLDANYIMTEVWLSEQRPSDAQRYLSVVEALDPYLAMRLAQGKPAPDDLIELPEADYKKAGQILSDQNPDWLNQLDDDNKVVDLGGDWSDSSVDDPTLKLRDSDDLLNLDLGDDDLSWLDEPTSPVADEETVVPEKSRKQTGLTGMLTKFDKGVEQENIPTEQINLEDLFNTDDDDSTEAGDDDDIMAWLTDATPENMTDDKPAELPSVPHDKDDPMAWLKASGIEIVDDSLSEEMLNKTKAQTEALNPDDPMAWLKASGVELSDEPDEQFTPYEKIESTTLKSQDDDPMAWLRDSDVEFLDDEPLVKNFVEDDDLPHDEADPMAWLKDSGVEFVEDEPTPPVTTPTASTTSPSWDDDSSFLDEMLSMEELTGQTGGLASVLNQPSATPEEDWQDTMANSNDDFPSWLSDTPPSDDDDFSFDDDQAEETPDWLMDSTSETNFDPNATNINFDFGDDETETVSDDETPDWLMDMKPTEQPVSADEFDFLSDDDADDTPAWMTSDTSTEATSFDPDATNIGFNFAELEVTSDDTEDDEFTLTEDDETPDWLMDMKPAEQPVSADEFDFLSDDGDDTPAWMATETATDTTFDPDATNIGFNFAELEVTSDDTEDDFALTEDEDTPDWLMGVSETVEETIQETSTDFSFNLGDETAEEETDTDFAFALADDETPEDEETPDWLMGMANTEDETVEETDADFAFALADDETPDAEETPDWLSGISDTEDETEEETDTDFAFALADDETPDAEDTPDWLSGISDTEEETVEEELDTDFAFALADDETPEDEDTPDWLSGISDTEEETVEEEVSDFAFSLADDETPNAEDTPDWLMGMADTDEEIAEEDIELSFLSDDDEALVTEDAPDWLMDAHPEADASDEKALDWLAEDEEPDAEETPSWLSALEDDEPSRDDKFGWVIDETETIGEFDETVPVTDMALSLADDVAVTPAENAPDWLNALVPGLDIDFDADEDAQVEQSFADSAAVASASANFGWLTAIVESEVNQPPMTMPSASTIVKPAETPTQTTTSSPAPSPRKWSFSKPPAWLNRGQSSAGIKPLGGGQNQPTTPSASSNTDDEFDDIDFEDDDDDDLPAWLRDDNDDEPDFLRDNF